jgi:hypothetical protein
MDLCPANVTKTFITVKLTTDDDDHVDGVNVSELQPAMGLLFISQVTYEHGGMSTEENS